MIKTPNYNLPQWQPTDITSWMSEDGLNGAFSKIDSALADNAAAATGAQSTANSAYTLAQNATQSIANLTELPISLTVTINPQFTNGNIFATYDKNREFLYVNGILNAPLTNGSITFQNLFTINYKPLEMRYINSGLNFLLTDSNGGVMAQTFAGVYVNVNGVWMMNNPITLHNNSSTHLYCQFTMTLNVQNWGLHL